LNLEDSPLLRDCIARRNIENKERKLQHSFHRISPTKLNETHS
jgi:hypothetical protein